MSTMYNSPFKLPDWKEKILRSVYSCTNRQQLKVVWRCIELFEARYIALVTPLELHAHTKHLLDAYFKKVSALTHQQVY